MSPIDSRYGAPNAARCLAISVLVLFGAPACSKAGDTVAAKPATVLTGKALPDGKAPTALVDALDSVTLAGLEQRTGEWKDADASSTWKAFVNDGSVRLIDERMLVGENSHRRVMHFYTSDGQISSHIETRDQTVMAGDRPPGREFVLMTLQFVGDSVIKAAKSVNGEPKSIEPFEIANARKHADVLLSSALVAPVTPPAKP